MTMFKEILRLFHEGQMSGREIAVSCRCSYTTVKRVLDRAKELNLSYDSASSMQDASIRNMLYPKVRRKEGLQVPDFKYIHNELARPGVTMTILWNEYCDKCRGECGSPYQYTQFCNLYKKYVALNKLTCHITHKPAEILEVDWAGTRMEYREGCGGQVRKASLFVACLPYSGYCYAEAMGNEKQESWLTAHVHAFNYFGGTAHLLRPDNLKTGVRKCDRYEPEINPAYRDLSEYYGCFVSPARIMKPRDKASVEGTVGMLTTCVIAALRNRSFTSLKELNNAVSGLLRDFNARQFQKKPGSRESLFMAEERSLLLPLPQYEYVIASYKEATVPTSYHVCVDGVYYSVPFQYVGRKVAVRTAGRTIEFFCGGERIASHIRSDKQGEFVTDRDHMPESHRRLYEWDETRYLEWGAKKGPSTLGVIQKIRKKNGARVFGTRFCAGLVSLEKKYGTEDLEAACSRVLSFESSPSLKSIKLALSMPIAERIQKNSANAGHDVEDTQQKAPVIGFRRGADYYGGGNND